MHHVKAFLVGTLIESALYGEFFDPVSRINLMTKWAFSPNIPCVLLRRLFGSLCFPGLGYPHREDH